MINILRNKEYQMFNLSSSDILSEIISYLSRHDILLINRISHHFNDFYNSNEYRTLLISKINMNLDFNKYSPEQLKNIFLMTKIQCSEGPFFIDNENLYHIDAAQMKITLLSESTKFVQLTGFALDKEGCVYDLKPFGHMMIRKIPNISEIRKLLGGLIFLDKNNNHQKLFYGSLPNVRDFFPVDNTNKIIKYDNQNICEKGILYWYDQRIFCDLYCFTQISENSLLSDMGHVYIIDDNDNIKMVPNAENIIQICYSCFFDIRFDQRYICMLLDNKGLIYYFDTTDIETDDNVNDVDIISIPELKGIIDISSMETFQFIARDYHRNVYVINFEQNSDENITFESVEILSY